MWGMPHARKMLNTTVVRQFFFGVLPVTPTSKIPARLNVDVAPNTGGKLVDQLCNFNRLKDGKSI